MDIGDKSDELILVINGDTRTTSVFGINNVGTLYHLASFSVNLKTVLKNKVYFSKNLVKGLGGAPARRVPAA